MTDSNLALLLGGFALAGPLLFLIGMIIGYRGGYEKTLDESDENFIRFNDGYKYGYDVGYKDRKEENND